jgi:disulfide bond formation protein DsbB
MYTVLAALFDWPLTRPRRVVALIALASAAMLGTAWAFQIFGELAPCALCLEQRKPYWFNIPVAAVAAIAATQLGRRGVGAVALVCGTAFAIGAAIAGYHTGLEQGWWVGNTACTAAIGTDLTFEELKAHILAAPLVRCDEVAWSLFSISMAGYNFIASVVLAGASAWAGRRLIAGPTVEAS